MVNLISQSIKKLNIKLKSTIENNKLMQKK